MFDLNTWQEIFNTIRSNKLRTFLTGFSISWGIFMLIILLGSGNGLKNGVMQNFDSETNNAMTIWQGYTSLPYDGFQKGRRIRFDDRDLKLLETEAGDVSSLSPSISKWSVISYNGDFVEHSMSGVLSGWQKIQTIEMEQGRFINDIDEQQHRKVIVLEQTMVDVLFRKEKPLGKYVLVDGLMFQVVGVYKRTSPWSEEEAFIPFSTARIIYNEAFYPQISFTVDGLNTLQENKDYNAALREKLSRLHSFDPKDRRAVWIWNRMEDYIETLKIFGGINIFIWIIGIGTLIAGIVGVSNIMLITVKERTREIGIRKAIGATPFSILRLIIMESIVITTIFGYIGLFGGVFITEILNVLMSQAGAEGSDFVIFTNPTVDMGIAISATLVMILAGVLAGYFPARKAVKIKPIEALRYE